MTTHNIQYHGFNYLGKRKTLLFIPLVLATGFVQADELKTSKTTKLNAVNVEAVELFDVPPPTNPIGTKQTISTSTITKQGGAEQTNFHKAVSSIPGVDVNNSDPYGATTTLRIRGKSHSNHGRLGETIEGLPLKGIGPGRSISFDLENIETISVSKGAIAADEGLGFSTDVGVIDLKIQRPKEEMGGKLKQSFGSYNFKRTFIRADSGNLGNTAKLFVSGSYTDADKWKGKGESPNGDTNLTFGISSTEQQKIQWEVFASQNKTQQHDYLGLSYEESKDLKNNYKSDFKSSLTGSGDNQYYDYNREEFDSKVIFGKLSIPVSDNSQIDFKSYYSTEKGYTLFANGKQNNQNNTVKWLIDHATYGATFDYKHQFENTDMVVGYWHGIHEPPGPPTSQKVLKANRDLEFAKWMRLEKAGNHVFKSPYIQLTHYVGNTEISAGLKHMSISSPDLQFYDTAGLTDANYKEVFKQNPSKLAYLPSHDYKFLLPNIGATHHLSENTTIRASLGRNYNNPNYSLGGQILGLIPNVDQATLETLWDSIKPSMSNNFDIGMSYQTSNFYFVPTLFYSHLKNKEDNVFDPDLGLSYHQNSGEASSYGLETAMGYRWSESLLTSFGFTYNKYEYTKNIPTANGNMINAKNNQIPNTPEIMASASVDWNIVDDLIFSPTVRYTGKRYADVLNENSVSAHTLVDLSLAKSWKVGTGKKLSLQSQLINVFNKHYISNVSISNASTPQSAMSDNKYYVGAPRTFTVSLQLDF